MPHIQKLYDRLKDRTDLSVVTLNVDDNIGLVEPFLQKNNFAFPVIPFLTLLDQMIPSWSIPRTWIVDKNGVVRQELVGFDSELDNWEDLMVEALDKVAKKGS